MKKTLKKVLALGAAAVMSISCLSFTAMADETEAKDYTIAVVVKGNTNGWFVRMEEGIKRYAEETGINAYMTGPSDTDSAQQIQVLQDVVSQNPDAICVVPIDPAACENVLAEAREKGIKVICHEGSSVIHHGRACKADG